MLFRSRFTSAVAAFGMLLRGSRHKGDASFAMVKKLAAAAVGPDKHGYRAEFLKLVDRAAALADKKARASRGTTYDSRLSCGRRRFIICNRAENVATNFKKLSHHFHDCTDLCFYASDQASFSADLSHLTCD